MGWEGLGMSLRFYKRIGIELSPTLRQFILSQAASCKIDHFTLDDLYEWTGSLAPDLDDEVFQLLKEHGPLSIEVVDES